MLDNIKEKAAAVAEEIKELDVGVLVSKGKNAVEKIDTSKLKALRYEFQDNAKYDGVRSLLRSGKDFVGNYPRYFIEGVVGAIQDKKEKY